MKGQLATTEFVIKIMMITLTCVVIISSLLTLLQFKVTIKTITSTRNAIDFSEAILFSPCIAEKHGMLNKTKLDAQQTYSENHKDDKDGFECLEIDEKLYTQVLNETHRWRFGPYYYPPGNKYMYFPTLIVTESNATMPALFRIVIT